MIETTACWDSVSTTHAYFVSQSLIGQLLMGAFNPIDVSFDYSLAHSSNSLRIASGRQ